MDNPVAYLRYYEKKKNAAKMLKFRRFWVKAHRHSKNVEAKKMCSTSIVARVDSRGSVTLKSAKQQRAPGR